MKDLAFFLGFGTLFAHELDSVINHEWRVIPVIRALPDETGSIIFIVAHIPILALLVALVASENSRTRRRTRIGIGLFMLIHGFLHILFKDHPAYEFSSMLSQALIFGGSILGILYLLLEWKGKAGNAA